MTQHTLLYIHKRSWFCKAEKGSEKAPEPEPQKPEITEEVANDYIKQNPDTVSNYPRNERAMKAQRKHINARSLSNNAFLIILFYFICNKKCHIRRKQPLVLFSLIS